MLHGVELTTSSTPCSFEHRAHADDPLPSASALVRAAKERIGGRAWDDITSFEAVATAKSAMGDARIEYRFIAPDSHLLVQALPNNRGVMEIGAVKGKAWMGEPGRARAMDPTMAHEMADGGDLQTLVRSIEDRFEAFETVGRESIDGKVVWKITMEPRKAEAPREATRPRDANDAAGKSTATSLNRWTLLIDAATGLVYGFDIPAPPTDEVSTATTATKQSIRLAQFEAVEHPSQLKDGAKLLAFREATVTAGGMQTTLVYAKVAVNMLDKNAIKPPATLDPAPTAPRANQ